MCGREGRLIKAKVEGTLLDFCGSSSRFGEIVSAPKKPFFKKKLPPQSKEEIIETIIPEYAKLIKNARERRGLKQEDVARGLAEKESLLNRIESGHQEPSIILARKLERFFKIRLLEMSKDKVATVLKTEKNQRKDTFTIGDFIKK